MSHLNWINDGTKIVPVSSAVNTTPKLKPGNYHLNMDNRGEYYLVEKEAFSLPKRFYDCIVERTDDVITAFNASHKNFGIMGVGDKGSGKSMLMQNICRELNIPVIMVTSALEDDRFKAFVSEFTQPVILFIDEFDKIYEKSHALLSLMDGTQSKNSKILWLLTANSTVMHWAMENRPSRIAYIYRYTDIAEDVLHELFINEYTIENLKSIHGDSVVVDEAEFIATRDSYIKRMIQLKPLYKLNIDSVMSLIRELLLRFGKYTINEILEYFNLKPSSDSDWRRTVYLNDVAKGTVSTSHPMLDVMSGRGFYTGICFHADEDYSAQYIAEAEAMRLKFPKLYEIVKQRNYSLENANFPIHEVVDVNTDISKITTIPEQGITLVKFESVWYDNIIVRVEYEQGQRRIKLPF